MNLKYLYSKIMGAKTEEPLVKVPFLTPEEMLILKENNIAYKEIGREYHVNALQAKEVFCH